MWLILCSCTSSGADWTVLSEEVTESCFVVKDLPRGASYVFRMGCITKTGAGPFSDASAPVVMATHPEGKVNNLMLHVYWFDVLNVYCDDILWNGQTATTREVAMFSLVFFLLYRNTHSSNPDWVTGVKGHWVRTTELQFPLWDQQVGILSRRCDFFSSVPYLWWHVLFIYCI